MRLKRNKPRITIKLNRKQERKGRIFLNTKLLHIGLLPTQSQWHDTTDMHLRTVHLHVKVEFLTNGLDVLKTLLVVGTSTTNPDLHLVLVEDGSNLTQGADDTLECGGDVGEVGNTTTNEQHLAVGVGLSPQHQVQHGTGVVVGLSLGGGTRVFTVVGKLTNEASRCNGICVDDRSTTASNEGPDTAIAVEDCELKRRTSLGVHVRDELLLLAHLTTKGGGEFHRGTSVDADLVCLRDSSQTQVGGAASNSPLGATLELSCLVELGSQVEEVHISRGTLSVGDDHQGVDFKVGELGVHVDSIETGDEVNQDIVDTLGHLAEQGLGDLLVGGVVLQVDGDEQLLSLSVDITNIDTTLVGEEDPVTLSYELARSIMSALETREGSPTSRTEWMLM